MGYRDLFIYGFAVVGAIFLIMGLLTHFGGSSAGKFGMSVYGPISAICFAISAVLAVTEIGV